MQIHLNVGTDLLAGTGLSRYVSIRKVVEAAERKSKYSYDFVLVDLPPSFGSLVRASFYSSDYYIVPCTSDNFSVYCVGLIGQMVPSFVRDWQSGLKRFKETNPHFQEFDHLGMPVFAGWIFNGFDTARERRTQKELKAGVAPKEKAMVQADETMHGRIVKAIQDDLVGKLNSSISGISGYSPIAKIPFNGCRIGDIEDANVLAQNSLWLSVPISQLDNHSPISNLQDRTRWADNQVEQIRLIGSKFDEMAQNLIKICK
jgi:chromosome partitioning protein